MNNTIKTIDIGTVSYSINDRILTKNISINEAMFILVYITLYDS